MVKLNVSHIDQKLLDQVSLEAQKSKRGRMNYNFHQPTDAVQRFLNAIEPGSYICPHRHVSPERDETFLVLRGAGAVLVFSDKGDIIDIYMMNASEAQWGVDIPGGLYHSIVSLEKNSVFYEIKPGPYHPDTDKGFAQWAPAAHTPEAVDYLAHLEREIFIFSKS